MNDFNQKQYASPEELLGHSFPQGSQLAELEPKDERLLQQSAKIGYLTGRNSAIENELYKKDQTIERMAKTINNLEEEVNRKNELCNDMCQDTELKEKVPKNARKSRS